MGRTFAIIYQVCVREQTIINIVPPQQISSILSMIVIKFEFDKQPCILLHTMLMRCFVLFSSVYCV